jgi:hypothetical protein
MHTFTESVLRLLHALRADPGFVVCTQLIYYLRKYV